MTTTRIYALSVVQSLSYLDFINSLHPQKDPTPTNVEIDKSHTCLGQDVELPLSLTNNNLIIVYFSTSLETFDTLHVLWTQPNHLIWLLWFCEVFHSWAV